MEVIFYIAGGIAVLATIMMLISLRPVHALLYLVVSLLAIAVALYTLGAPFVAALEVIIYAGAIMVLFIFVVMLLNLGDRTSRAERALFSPHAWVGPSILAGVLVAEFIYLLAAGAPSIGNRVIQPQEVGMSLFGPYLIGVELASMLLLGGLVGAYHLGRRKTPRGEMQ